MLRTTELHHKPALVRSYVASSPVKFVKTVSTCTLKSDEDIVKSYLIEEINRVSKFRSELKNKYPRLFSHASAS